MGKDNKKHEGKFHAWDGSAKCQSEQEHCKVSYHFAERWSFKFFQLVMKRHRLGLDCSHHIKLFVCAPAHPRQNLMQHYRRKDFRDQDYRWHFTHEALIINGFLVARRQVFAHFPANTDPPLEQACLLDMTSLPPCEPCS